MSSTNKGIIIVGMILCAFALIGSSHEPAEDRYDWAYTANDAGAGFLEFRVQAINEDLEDAGVQFAAQVHLKMGNTFLPASPDDYVFTVVTGSVLSGIATGMTTGILFTNSNGELVVRVEDLQLAGGTVEVMIEGLPIRYPGGFADGPGDTLIRWDFATGMESTTKAKAVVGI